MNSTGADTSTYPDILFFNYMNFANLILSFTGLLFNSLVVILLIFSGRRHCTTYFLLLLMAICDCLYCIVYASITLTVNQYLNIINHEILCPLSFFLTPFTFTGSTLLLLICLLHFITDYVRKYDSALGQISGRLSFVFVLAFVIIRSVLSSTSIELVIPEDRPDIKVCTIDMNIPKLVETVQTINHFFAEVTDILVYVGWITILLMHVIRILRQKFSNSNYGNGCQPSGKNVKPSPLKSILFRSTKTNKNYQAKVIQINVEAIEVIGSRNDTIVTTNTFRNKQRHKEISSIILMISSISIVLYLPIMLGKYLTMHSTYVKTPILNLRFTFLLQIIQHTSHLFCLSTRFIPYLIFEKRIRMFIHRMIGMKCIKDETNRNVSKKSKHKFKRKIIWNCQCHQQREISDFKNCNEFSHE